MSDTPSASTSTSATTKAVPVETVTVTPAGKTLDFADASDLLKLALSKISVAELQAELSLDDKIKKVVDELKAEIRAANLPADVRVTAIDWCDDALPHVIRAVDFVKAELKKAVLSDVAKVEELALKEIAKVEAVVVADVKKCCPSLFARKTPAKAA